MKIRIGDDVEAKWERYKVAQAAKSSWTAEEKAAKSALLLALGYDPEDPKPAPAEFTDDHGFALFEVKVGERRGLDTTYLKRVHPDVYAESERVTHPVSIREKR